MFSSEATHLAIDLGCGLAAGGLAVGGFFYASLWPASRIFGSALIAPRTPGELALTFDDGPNPVWTPRLLETLAKHKVRATFFMMGQHAAWEPALAREVHAAGHLVGLHSFSHPNLSRSSKKVIREELVRNRGTLEEILGSPVRFFRPPFGARRPAVFTIARELGLTTTLWNAMTSDWSDRDPDLIAQKLTAKVEGLTRKGFAANVVLHDGGHLDVRVDRGPSVAAAGRLVEKFKPTHRFVTLDAWA
ncbi:polysaccharide deacetylase family protein [Telmatobacter bradus]|uniref:polysaccharide deacetylase family protein n=1 Tax=Telmatobacter bradus TaxID=474953 RepID=UPI003B436EEF